MNFKNIIFDLDGTLVNSFNGITNAVTYALDKMGKAHGDKNSLREFIGPPLITTFMESYGMSREEGETAVALYREYYREHGVYECELYPGIPELLEYIKQNGGRMYIATSKPQNFTEIIINHLGIAEYFDFVQGVTFGNSEVTKDVLINSVIDKFSLDKTKTVMVGDTKFDIASAKKVNITAIGVLYGFGSEAELKENGADITVKSVKDMSHIL